MSDYNQEQLDSGKLTSHHISTLTRFWQEHHGLLVDGQCGPMTIASLDASGQTSDLAETALTVAREWIGKGEEGGNNSGPFVEWLHGKEYDGDPDDDGNWCAAFVSACFEEAGKRLSITMPFQRTGGAKALYRRVGKAGRFVQAPDIQPGDVIAWDRGTPGDWRGHVGIVERYEADTGLLHTIEGNVGRYPAKVRRRVHDMGNPDRLEGISRI